MLKIILRIIIYGVAAFVVYCITVFGFLFLTKDNIDYNYFEIKNNTKTHVKLSLYYADELYLSEIIAPLGNREVKTFTHVRGGLKFIIINNEEVEVLRDYHYTIFGKSFFFKTKYLLEYDGKEIKEIYARKIDCGIFCIFYDEDEIVPR